MIRENKYVNNIKLCCECLRSHFPVSLNDSLNLLQRRLNNTHSWITEFHIWFLANKISLKTNIMKNNKKTGGLARGSSSGTLNRPVPIQCVVNVTQRR